MRIVSRSAPSPDDMRAEVKSIAFLPGSHDLVTGNNRNEMIFWQSSTGTIVPLGDMVSTRQTIVDLAVSPGGGLLATLDEERNLRFWDVASRNQVGGALKIPDEPLRIAFAKDGRSFEILMSGDRVLAFPLDNRSLYERACLVSGKDPAFCAKAAITQE